MNGFEQPFNTDFWAWSGSLGDVYSGVGVTGEQPREGRSSHPAMPALWWLGILIALIAIRMLSSKAG